MILVLVGLLVTAAWIWAGWYYVTEYVGQSSLLYMLPVELGTFLVGFLAPLGILWLLISQSATRRRLARLERAIAEMTSAPPRASGPPGAAAPAGSAGAPPPRLEPTIESKGAEAAGRKADPSAPRPAGAPPRLG